MNKEYLDNLPANLTHNVIKEKLLIRFARYLNAAERAVISNGLQSYFLNDFTVMMDITEIKETMNTAVYFLTLFNIIVAAMASILTFFFTLVSFVANV